MSNAPVACRSAIVWSDSRPARSASSARSRSVGPRARTLSRTAVSVYRASGMTEPRGSGGDPVGELDRDVLAVVLEELLRAGRGEEGGDVRPEALVGVAELVEHPADDRAV